MSIKILQDAEQKLYHATNLEDFIAYWGQQGVLSRSCLQDTCSNFTRFFSDEKDKDLKVWDRSFGNLNDFGGYFWKRESSTPNAYGPITLVFSDKVWLSLSDIRITKNTITAVDPSIITPENWSQIYKEVDGKSKIKSGYTACEISVAEKKIPFDNLAYILVDPIRVGGISLRDRLRDSIKVDESTFNLSEARIIEREIECAAQEERISQLIEWSQNLKGKLIKENRPLAESLPVALREWFNRLEEWKKRILASWLTYTYNGTIRLMENEANNAQEL